MDLQQLSGWTHSPDELFDRLAHELAAAGRWHELFEARLVEARWRLGLSLTDSPSLDELPEPTRSKLEGDYTAACREVGGLLLDAGRPREAWRYLRPAGEKRMMRAALAREVATAENIEALIELALYDGIDIERGFGWMLGHLGTCNAITTLEGLAHQLTQEDLAACAAALVRHVDRELRENLQHHIARVESASPPARATVLELIEGRDWLFDTPASHVDASHLAATVRFARVLTLAPLVEVALGLATYGAKLDAELQYAGEPPFDELYLSHCHFFRATLGRDVEAALDYFRQRANLADVESEGTAPLETLLVLLQRTGRTQEALEMYATVVPADAQLSPFAPRLVELAAHSGDWDRYEAIVRERDDPVGLAIGLVHRQQRS